MNEDRRQIFVRLLDTDEPAHLGPRPRPGTLDESALRAQVIQSFSTLPHPEIHRELVLALLLLWHDHLGASHLISQGIATSDGSFIHAMMHRREADYWNSKYWWRRTGHHPAFKPLGLRAAESLRASGEMGLERRVVCQGNWNPDAFVDACEAVADHAAEDPSAGCLRELQRIEFRGLLDHLLHS